MPCINRRVWAVLQFLDESTWTKVQDSGMKLITNADFEAVAKGDGVFVIIKTASGRREAAIPESGVNIKFRVESPMYESFCGELSLSPREAGYEYMSIYLIPSQLMPKKPFFTSFEGKAEAGSRVYLACRTQKMQIKLLKDYVSGNEIEVFHKDHVKLDGRYVGCFRKGKFLRTMLIDEEKADGRCTFGGQQAAGEMKKNETEIYPLYRAVADENGYFRVLIGNTLQEDCDYILLEVKDNGKEALKEGRLLCGKRNIEA